MSGREAAKQDARIVIAWAVLGSALEAIKNPARSAKEVSKITIWVLRRVGFPYFSVSVFK